MTLSPKTVQCKCGNSIVMEQSKVWCKKCNRPVFYEPKDNLRNKFNNFFVIGAICASASFLTYVFIKLWESWQLVPMK